MKEYLVVYKIDGVEYSPTIETESRIFERMSMDDCYDIEIVDIRLFEKGYPECKFFGKWHNSDDPLRMEIRAATGGVLSVGYAPDH